ncbi:MAG TPA: aspartate/glutamate racemase family protein [Acidobacteriaceae bacterium]|jgi:aspartate racemase
MSKGRCLGLVGGLGVGATIHYYSKLAEAHQARGRTMDCVITHGETSRVFDYVKAGNPGGLAEYLNSFLHRLKAAGAEVGVIPAVTPHYALRELLTTSPLPLISMIEPLAVELASRNARRVAVFGTRYSVESGFFGLLEGIEFVRPEPDEVDFIHRTYEELLRDGRGSDEQHLSLTALAHTLRRRDGVDAILLAGTDLSLIFNAANTDFPHVDCAAVHIQAVAKRLLDS